MKMKIMKIVWLLLMSWMRNLWPSRVALANTDRCDRSGFVGLANVFGGGEEWVQLSPYGDFPHPKGIQRMNRVAAEGMANHFSRISSKLARLFAGVPFYVGHPDLPGLENEYPDTKAYGWVKGLEARDDGLYGKVEWSEPGKQMLANAHYKFLSPYWFGEPIGTEKGKTVYKPVELASVGLTNHPRIPVNPLANEAEAESADQQNKIMEQAVLIALLGLANEATEEQIKSKITGLVNSQNEAGTVRTSLTNEQTAHSTTRTTLENQFKAERKARCELLVNEAIRDGRVPAAKKADRITALEKDFEKESVALANEKKTPIKTEPQTRDQGGRREAFANVESRGRKVQALVNEKMRGGMSYDDAWSAVKEEQAALFNEMHEPKSEANEQE
jgi:phage I-like protein